jgi:hypothetical protein
MIDIILNNLMSGAGILAGIIFIIRLEGKVKMCIKEIKEIKEKMIRDDKEEIEMIKLLEQLKTIIELKKIRKRK